MKPRFKNWKPPKLIHGIPTKYGWTPYHPDSIKIGKFSDIGWGTFLNGKYGIEIGEYVQIGPQCDILSDNSINGTHSKIVIMRHAVIGAHTDIFPRMDDKPLIIGEGAKIASHCIITKDVMGMQEIKPYTKW